MRSGWIFGATLLFVFAACAGRATAGSCERRDVVLLVDQCLEVSPATHPPCNADNPCGLIVSEIRRGCAMLDAKDRPRFCDAY